MEPDRFEITPRGWRASFTVTNSTGYAPYQIQMPVNSSVAKEMAVIEAIDRLVDSGLTHPEADRILNKLSKTGDSDV